MCIYPKFINNKYDFVFTVILIVAISINYFMQYYFGIVDRLLLIADQKGYIFYLINSIALILNTIGSTIMIFLGFQIHYVKLFAALVYIIRPFILRIYVNKHYCINRHIDYAGEPIKQKWNGFIQHLASFVLDGTDTIVLSVFSTLENVSIYAVYYLVIKGVRELFISMTNGIQAYFGELWAKKEINELNSFFEKVEWFLHTGTIFFFGSTACLIIPFIQVYTKGINDANYIQPLFAFILTFANAFRCLRLPYNLMIFATGKFKETQNNYIIAVLLNLVISIVTVVKFGLVGVAIGTLVSTVYQTVGMALFTSRKITNIPIIKFIKQMIVDIITIIASMLIYCFFIKNIYISGYFEWCCLAVLVCFVWIVDILLVNTFFYKNRLVSIFSTINKIKRRFK